MPSTIIPPLNQSTNTVNRRIISTTSHLRNETLTSIESRPITTVESLPQTPPQLLQRSLSAGIDQQGITLNGMFTSNGDCGGATNNTDDANEVKYFKYICKKL